ncbi:hypothetical protein AVEN_130102-1 [Araneus ventricosus]|uniref:Uncharacterized protein n=1 Tax=Araneus ventricosus TaxID=182803 RepID=A0A4Y2EM63_ARAVE|nr:hypothetical protein AVEN_130102-1 [Araneus ventricosus]
MCISRIMDCENRPEHNPNLNKSSNHTISMTYIRNSFCNRAWAVSNLPQSVRLQSTDLCGCVEEGRPIQYATECPLTSNNGVLHFTAFSQGFGSGRLEKIEVSYIFLR